jgi:hypothetical protein
MHPPLSNRHIVAAVIAMQKPFQGGIKGMPGRHGGIAPAGFDSTGNAGLSDRYGDCRRATNA